MSASWVLVRCIGSGRYLINRRVEDEKDTWSGKMGLFGGRRDAGETGIRAAQREFYEETGMTIAAGHLTWIERYRQVDRRLRRGYASDYYLLEVPSEFIPKLDLGEHQSYEWCAVDSLPRADDCHVALSFILTKMRQIAVDREADELLVTATQPASGPGRVLASAPEFSTRTIRGVVSLTQMSVGGIPVAEAGVGQHNNRLYGLKVYEGHRRHGYSRLLMNHLLASEHPPTNLNAAPFANSPLDVERLIAFYASCGFRVVPHDNPQIIRMERSA